MDEAVREVQEYLRNISRYDSGIPMIAPDGIYGSETTDSVRAFQKKHLLEESGNVNLSTWNKILEENDKASFFFSLPNRVAPITNNDLPLKKGKPSKFNYNLNLMLNHLADNFTNFDPVVVSSVFDENTERQVKNFQRVISTEITGEADKETWNKLAELYLIL